MRYVHVVLCFFSVVSGRDSELGVAAMVRRKCERRPVLVPVRTDSIPKCAVCADVLS